MVVKSWGVVAMLLGAVGIASEAPAQAVYNNEMSCIRLSELQNTDTPPRLARSVRDCVAKERYVDAMTVLMAFSAYGTFDQQRVRDGRANGAMAELNGWIFGGLPPYDMAQLRAVSGELRGGNTALLVEACAALLMTGPPAYSPGYLVDRGGELERSDMGWQLVGFNAGLAWEKSLVDVNGCPHS